MFNWHLPKRPRIRDPYYDHNVKIERIINVYRPLCNHLETIALDIDLIQRIVVWLSHRSQEALGKWRTQAKITQEKKMSGHKQKKNERQRKQEVCME